MIHDSVRTGSRGSMNFTHQSVLRRSYAVAWTQYLIRCLLHYDHLLIYVQMYSFITPTSLVINIQKNFQECWQGALKTVEDAHFVKSWLVTSNSHTEPSSEIRQQYYARAAGRYELLFQLDRMKQVESWMAGRANFTFIFARASLPVLFWRLTKVLFSWNDMWHGILGLKCLYLS